MVVVAFTGKAVPTSSMSSGVFGAAILGCASSPTSISGPRSARAVRRGVAAGANTAPISQSASTASVPPLVHECCHRPVELGVGSGGDCGQVQRGVAVVFHRLDLRRGGFALEKPAWRTGAPQSCLRISSHHHVQRVGNVKVAASIQKEPVVRRAARVQNARSRTVRIAASVFGHDRNEPARRAHLTNGGILRLRNVNISACIDGHTRRATTRPPP